MCFVARAFRGAKSLISLAFSEVYALIVRKRVKSAFAGDASAWRRDASQLMPLVNVSAGPLSCLLMVRFLFVEFASSRISEAPLIATLERLAAGPQFDSLYA